MQPKSMTEKEYAKGNMSRMVIFLAETYKFDVSEAAEKMKEAFPELKNKSVCPNCKASMEQYWYNMTNINALLLLQMGNVVKRNMRNGQAFHEANQVHISTEIKDYAIASSQTLCSKLGLIAKILNEDGTHDRSKGWLITTRGFAFLRGEPIPKKVKVWRNEIQERCEETVTIGELFAGTVTSYSANDWVEFAGPHQQAML